MTVKELREALEGLEASGHADHRVTVNCFGGGLRGSNAEVKNVGPGFDWTSGQVVLGTTPALSVYQKPDKPAR